MKEKSRKAPPKTQISVRIDNRIMAAFQEVQETTGYSKDQMIEEGFPLALQQNLKMDPLTKEVRRICNAATLDENWLALLFCAHLRQPLDPLQETSRDALLKMLRLLPTMPWFNDVLATYKTKPIRRGRRKAQEE